MYFLFGSCRVSRAYVIINHLNQRVRQGFSSFPSIMNEFEESADNDGNTIADFFLLNRAMISHCTHDDNRCNKKPDQPTIESIKNQQFSKRYGKIFKSIQQDR